MNECVGNPLLLKLAYNKSPDRKDASWRFYTYRVYLILKSSPGQTGQISAFYNLTLYVTGSGAGATVDVQVSWPIAELLFDAPRNRLNRGPVAPEVSPFVPVTQYTLIPIAVCSSQAR